MDYDVTELTLRPAVTAKAMPGLKAWLEANRSGELLACWTSEIGALNQVLIIKRFSDDAEMSADRAAAATASNPYGCVELIDGISRDTYRMFDFMPPLAAGTHGPYYEVRRYAMKAGGVAPTIELWRKHTPKRMERSPLLAAMYSITGALPRFLHVWPYQSLDERHRVRTKATGDGVWPPPGGPDWLNAMQTDIFLPTPFSPLN